MTTLTLSPLVLNVCMKSEAFRRRLARDQLNVCNVTRTFLYLLVTRYLILPAILAVFACSFVQLFYVMWTQSLWLPMEAANVLGHRWDAIKDFDNANLYHWYLALSFLLAVVTSFVLYLVGILGAALGVCLGGYWGIDKLKSRTSERLTRVLTPIGLAIEWNRSRKSLFCVRVQAPVPQIKVDHGEQIEKSVVEHQLNLAKMNRRQLEAAVANSIYVLSSFKT